MKKILAILVVMSISGQAMSMGHPHNLFAARKHIKAKLTTASAPKSVHIAQPGWSVPQQVTIGLAIGNSVIHQVQQLAR